MFFFGLGLKYLFEWSLKQLLHILKGFNAFQWVSCLLRATCVIFACAISIGNRMGPSKIRD